VSAHTSGVAVGVAAWEAAAAMAAGPSCPGPHARTCAHKHTQTQTHTHMCLPVGLQKSERNVSTRGALTADQKKRRVVLKRVNRDGAAQRCAHACGPPDATARTVYST